MEKIDLNASMHSWYEQAVLKYGTLISPETKVKVRHILYVLPFAESDARMRTLCGRAFCDFFDYDLREVCVLLYLLGKYGLRFEMTDEELAEYDGKPLPQKCADDGIDWAQRRWEMAKDFYKLGIWFPKECIEKADRFIGEYKKSKEEKQ